MPLKYITRTTLRSGKKIGEQYNTKQVMEFMKDVKEDMTLQDFEEVEMQFPGAFGGVAVIWEQFEARRRAVPTHTPLAPPFNSVLVRT